MSMAGKTGRAAETREVGFDEPLSESSIRVFGGSGNPPLATRIAAAIGVPLGRARVDRFPDGETIVKLEDDVRGRDCFVIQPTCPPVNENLMELLIFIDCLRRASARRITAVIPYFGYARQDRKAEGRTPITAKLVANLLTEAGADRILTMDLHADQLQGFFDIPLDHLTAMPVICKFFQSQRLTDAVLVSPDVGNVKTANEFAAWIGGDLAVIDKRRVAGDRAKARRLIGEVKGRSVLMFDDMITTAGTISEAVKLLREYGAKAFYVSATHPVFAPPAVDRLEAVQADKIVVTDTIPVSDEVRRRLPNLEVLTVSGLMADAIRRIHANRSVSALFDRNNNSAAPPAAGAPVQE